MAPRAVIEARLLEGLHDGASLELPDAVAHRFGRVLRLAADSPIEVVDGAGHVVSGRFLPPRTLAHALVRTEANVLPPLWVVQAMTKADKLEQVVQRACELGASHVVLFDAERSQVHLDDDRADKRRARLLRVAEDAARQSGRARIPDVDGPVPLAEVMRRCAAFPGLCVAGVLDAERTLSEALQAEPARATQGMVAIIGPEGGLSPREHDALATVGVVPVRMGAHVLRTETAGLVALAAAQAFLGHL